jgi:flagellin
VCADHVSTTLCGGFQGLETCSYDLTDTFKEEHIMGLRINHNAAAANSYRNLSVTDGQMAKSLEKLSSGFRINRAADDAAGLSISEGMRAQIGGLKVAVRNAQDGISLVQTAEGALTEVHSLLQRVRDLSVQAANTGSNTSDARAAASSEASQALAEIDRISKATEFGGKKLLDGSVTSGFTFQVGSGASSENQVNVAITSMSSNGLGLQGTAAKLTSGNLIAAQTGGTIDLTFNPGTVAGPAGQSTSTLTVAGGPYNLATAQGAKDFEAAVNAGLSANATLNGQVSAKVISGTTSGTYALEFSTTGTGTNATLTAGASTLATGALTAATGTGVGSIVTDIQAGSTGALSKIDTAISSVSTQRASLGAYQNRFEHTIANLNVTVENLSASESRIRDTDMAQEMVMFTRSQILTQAGTSMLAQANSSSQSVLSLLRG